MFVPLLEVHSLDEKVTNLILKFLLNQSEFSDEILKFLSSYFAMNIERKSHQKFILSNIDAIRARLVPILSTSPDAKKIILFLIKRFPVKMINHENLWENIDYHTLNDLLSVSCNILGKAGSECDHYYDLWTKNGKGLYFMNSLKPRGFEEFLAANNFKEKLEIFY